MLPRYQMQGSEGTHHYKRPSGDRSLVASYTGLNFLEIGQLDYITFLLWRRDAFIHQMEQTEAGREYLHNAWRMEQTKPDRKKLRQKLRSEG